MNAPFWKPLLTQLQSNLNALGVRMDDIANVTADADGDDLDLTVHLTNGKDVTVRAVGGVAKYWANAEAERWAKYSQPLAVVH